MHRAAKKTFSSQKQFTGRLHKKCITNIYYAKSI